MGISHLLEQALEVRTIDLARATNRLEKIVETMAEALIIIDSKGLIMDLNAEAIQVFEYEKHELIGKSAALVLGAETLDSILVKGRTQIFEGGFLRNLESEYKRRSKGVLYLSLSVSFICNTDRELEAIVCTARDITNKRRMETQLLKAQSDYKNLFNSAPVPMAVIQKGQIVFFNSELENHLGYPPEAIRNRDILDFIPDEGRAELKRHQARLKEGDKIRDACTICYQARCGAIRLADVISTNIAWGSSQAILSYLIDVTEQREMDIALRTSEEQYRSLVQSLNIIIMRVNSHCRITFLNQFGQDFFGYTEKEVLGKDIIGTLTPRTESGGRNLEQLMRQIVMNPEEHTISENENITKDGTRKKITWRNSPIYDENGYMVEILSSGYDITERRQAEEQIMKQSQELQAAQQQMNVELNQARLAQRALLPTEMPCVSNLKLAVKYTPMAQIGGDFYDMLINREGNLELLIGDVTGHGIPAALLSFMYLTTFKNRRCSVATPDQVLDSANRFLSGKLPDGKYATAFYCSLDPENLVLRYSSAGHPPAFLLRSGSNKPQLLETPGMVVGMFAEPLLPYVSQTVNLKPGDKVLIYTDGMLEVTDANGRALDTETLERFAASQHFRPIEELLEQVYNYCSAYAGHQGFKDDVSMIGFEVLE